MNRKLAIQIGRTVIGCAVAGLWLGCDEAKDKEFVRPKATITFKAKDLADSLYAVIAADREIYAREVVHRLAYETKTLKVGENWKEEKCLPVPSQVLRLGSENVAARGVEFAYTVRSLWPLSKKGAPETAEERKGLQFVAEHPDQSFYADEQLGGRHYFTAIYPDRATVSSCAECHNAHPKSPRRNFRVGDVMGGIIVRIAMEL